MSSTPRIPNGVVHDDIELTSLPPVVGINFGNSYASIAVFTKEGLAECIANEDGERQIACAISFHGEEMYIGNQAKHQLVKNAQNTITGFRNLLGKRFSEIPQSAVDLSAPVIQHPDLPDTPAYKVTVLQPSPSPLPPGSTVVSTYNTPQASALPTPRSEPIQVDRYLTADEVTTIFLRSLVSSAQAFLGKKVRDAVITVPSWFTPPQREALLKAASETGVNVLQLLDEAAAAVSTTTSTEWDSQLPPDRTQLLIDVGASSTSITLLSIRSGLAHILSTSTTPDLGGDTIDTLLIHHFSSEFTKKTKIPLSVGGGGGGGPSSVSSQDKRAEAKLRLALEYTKRTISASPGAATCSVESLKEGIDYTGSINRMRFDLIARKVYSSISSCITSLLLQSSPTPIDPHEIDEIVYVGGSASLPGLDEHICLSLGFREDVETPFVRGTVVGGGTGDPTTILARGCALQAHLISTLSHDSELQAAFADISGGSGGHGDVGITTKTIGVLLPSPASTFTSQDDDQLGGIWIPVVHKETPLPARRAVRFDIQLPSSSSSSSSSSTSTSTSPNNNMTFEIWEIDESIKIDRIKPVPEPLEEGEEDQDHQLEEDEEEIEVKSKQIQKTNLLGVIQMESKFELKTNKQQQQRMEGGIVSGGKTTTVDMVFSVAVNAELKVIVTEVGSSANGGGTGVGNGEVNVGTLVVPGV